MLSTFVKTTLVATGLCAALLLPPSLLPAQEEAPAETSANLTVFKVDPVHSGVSFRVRHMNLTWFHASFDEISGEIHLDEADFTNTKIVMTVPVDSLDTNHPDRDAHVKQEDGLAAESHPDATFTSTAISPKADTEGTYTITGDLSFRGVTQPIAFDFTPEAPREFRGKRAVGGVAEFTISRDSYGMNSYGGGVGDEVVVTVFIEALAG